MKSARKSGLDGSFKQRPWKQPGQTRDRADERKETLVLLAIALLFIANVVLYLCHHYGLTSLIETRPRGTLSVTIAD